MRSQFCVLGMSTRYLGMFTFARIFVVICVFNVILYIVAELPNFCIKFRDKVFKI
jgi:hypothetical protein